ncbi:hypothetical protein M2282_005203 [Variovorax boronicumulans]|uniref:hypothetical protein n=1 Tax=Variovorax boronicumulans TaxID=436515 RepID=UPI0024757535|nr:hypothetical protein [Variovorax boronicumulans]MDH6170033.1 hypothetical protein [Variovorax boronicumulans]
MPMDFLRRIEDAAFPLTVRSESEIDCAAVLAAAELIEAVLPPPGREDIDDRVAVIVRITFMGRAELNRLRQKERLYAPKDDSQ